MTMRFFVVTKEKPPVTIGMVAWYSQWRQYAFLPAHMTVFERVCLRDIADFIERLTQEHRTSRRARADLLRQSAEGKFELPIGGE